MTNEFKLFINQLIGFTDNLLCINVECIDCPLNKVGENEKCFCDTLGLISRSLKNKRILPYEVEENDTPLYTLKEVDFPTNWHRIADEVADTVERKNADYGNSFEETVNKYGNVAYALRLDDKLSRFNSLAVKNKDQKVDDENVKDTLTDIIGYTLLMLEIMERGIPEND